MDNRCNTNFQSQYAYIDGQPIHIDEYEQLIPSRKNDIYCQRNHELTAVIHTTKKKTHFRHKHSANTTGIMTAWHSAWQGEFEVQEFTFIKIDKQIKERHADAYIENHNLVIEFQHSPISKEEVDNRKHDYNLHNVNIIWIIDGNQYVECTPLNDNRVFLTFNVSWLYDSFLSYDIIYLDYKDKLYKIYPSHIKNKMIDVATPFQKNNFIQLIKENNPILFNIQIPDQCTLYIKQQGAGNGKTYGIIQQLEADEFSHYKQFIIVSKQHASKEIIYREFNEQIKNNKLNFINNLQILNEKKQNTDKKYILSYNNSKTKTTCQLIISTIDSLMFQLGNNSAESVEMFTTTIQSIIDDYIQLNNINRLSYKATDLTVDIKLNKEVCIIIDETQDLAENYANALIKLMRSRYVDAFVVGDKLQSITYEQNAFNYFENDFPYIKKKCYGAVNICRRFNNQTLIDFCNNVIDYNKYNLPFITPFQQQHEYNSNLNFIECEDRHKDTANINKNIEKIIDKYIFEVENNNCQPNDFLFVTPFTKINVMMDAIEIAINKYWNAKYNNIEYIRYALFHKSEMGTSIDTTLSNNATRMVSIHSAKGDTRKIVFVIGCEEQSLKKFSKGEINLIYESLFHVAITRMSEKLYFTYVANNDNIHQRITKYCINNDTSIIPSITLTRNIRYTDIINTDTNDIIFDKLKENIMKYCNYDDCINDSNKQLIDMQHHNIRCYCMQIAFWLKIINKNEQTKNQLMAVLLKIKKANISTGASWKEYNDKLFTNKDYNFQIGNKEKRHLCILSYNENDSQYKRYNTIIIKYINSLIKKIDKILNLNTTYLCPYESIILYYMYSVCEYGIRHHDLTITELYALTDIYYKSFTHDIVMHTECDCKKTFPNNNKDGVFSKYLLSHYEKINILNNEYDIFLNNNPNINILLSHSFQYNGFNDDYKIKKILLVGYNDDVFYNIYIYPSFNKLNHNQFLIDSMYDTYFIQNRSSDKDDKKINGKIIKTVLFSCDINKHYIFDWNYNNECCVSSNGLFFKYRIRQYMLNLHMSQITTYYQYINYKYNISTATTPLDKIQNIQEEIEPDKNIPIYLKEYIRCIYDNISESSANATIQQNIDDILNYDNFKTKIERKIESSINRYLHQWKATNTDTYLMTYDNKLNVINDSSITTIEEYDDGFIEME